MSTDRIYGKISETKPDPIPERDVPLMGDSVFVPATCANCWGSGFVIQDRCDEARHLIASLICEECKEDLKDLDGLENDLVNARLQLSMVQLNFDDNTEGRIREVQMHIKSAEERLSDSGGESDD